jgi:hypothetical protein
MISQVDERLRREAELFELRFGCESCAHFEPERARCGDGFPTAPHVGVQLAVVESMLFCKGFELS